MSNHMIYLISGEGRGAGKTTYAKRIADKVFSIANPMRAELQHKYPQYDWYNTSQQYKDNVIVKELNKTVRDVMIAYGQQQFHLDNCCWVKKLAEGLKSARKIADGCKVYAVDDVRKVCELQYLRENFEKTIHIHILSNKAISEPEMENEKLKKLADYRLSWDT